MYSCNCNHCIRAKREHRAHFKVVLGLEPVNRNYLCATAIGKVANVQGFISLEEINHFRPLENSIFISTRMFCISLLRM